MAEVRPNRSPVMAAYQVKAHVYPPTTSTRYEGFSYVELALEMNGMHDWRNGVLYFTRDPL
jgi:hypothetical protein